MEYTKQTWADGEAGGTPITAEKLNHIEQGIYNVTNKAITTFGCTNNAPTYNVATGFGVVNIPLNVVLTETNNNEKFTLNSDYSIKIGAGVSKIKVCGCVAINRGKTGYITCWLKKNNSNVAGAGIPFSDWYPTSCQIEPIILEVAENDVLTFNFGSGADSAQNYTGYNANTTTYLTIEEI